MTSLPPPASWGTVVIVEGACPHCGTNGPAILARLSHIEKQLEKVMTDQDTEAALAQEIEADVQAGNAATSAIAAEIAALEAAHPAVDFTALKQAVADAGTALAGEQALVPPAAG
jgi:predicted DNA binding CopG/RHH family protein